MANDSAANGHPTMTVRTTVTSEEILEPFVQSTFDPAEYLNSALPSLALTASTRDQGDRASLSNLSSKTQLLLSQLNAQTSRLSDNLTQLTDEIIRSGSRLAYEVEILRGETNGLSEVLLEKLQDDFSKFEVKQDQSRDSTGGTDATEPEHIQQLRTLTRVRGRLDAVIKVFGDAMEWPVPPSELSSSLISVTAPNITPEEQRNREEKGKEAAQRLRENIVNLLETGRTQEEGVAVASERINDLRRLAIVWKGTAEERYRNRFIDGLAKLVEDEQKKIAKRSEGRRQAPTIAVQPERRSNDQSRGPNETSYGFMNSLRKIRGDIYID
ncbi:hypothetical protein BDZ85DRAFT_254552 [Elsinoe ampelina]|uniref:Uncharacterized protein n=1 Tax=Elsinoe ampelina TaxID=302913 RepID=A0A6A6GQE2_9PEZI|nr:hypothetical protein BDZ85DRAFT_254552 [Elsinoe ampelina]